jgi:AcrR family transcriptional regulator
VTRAPRQARGARTRERLLEATITCLVAYGYAGTTMQRVQREAGVSRGALTHHFASMDDLLVGAVHHVARRQLDELRAARLPCGRDDHNQRAAVHLLHSFMSGPLFLAGLELWMAARTTPTLHDALVPVERELGRELRAALVARDRRPSLDVDDLEDLLVTLRGLAVTSVLRTNPALEDAVLERWIARVTDRPRDGAALDG